MVATLDAPVTVEERPPVPWRAVVACLAALLLGVGIGMALQRRTVPSASSVDVRFLQDMRLHHEQAVGMSLMMLDKPAAASDATVRSVAREIVQSQSFEGGRMGEMLTSWSAPVANEGETAMEWMAMPVPLGEMPGMASPDDTAALQSAAGRAADKLFVRLMIAHHEGGIHMAEYALAHAGRPEVRALAGAIVSSQRAEIQELQAVAARL